MRKTLKRTLRLILAASLLASCANPFLLSLRDGEKTAGAAAQNGTGTEPAGIFLWRGPHPDQDSAAGGQSPREGWAYYDTGNNAAYVYTGGQWQSLTAAPGVAPGIVWRGSSGSHPDSASEGWAYYDTAAQQAYVVAP
jgi:hypothetical protein